MSSGKVQKEEKSLKKAEISVKKKRRNYVIEDEIMREVVGRELTSQMKFEDHWNFLKAENLDKIYEELKRENSINMSLLREFSKYYKKERSHSAKERLEEIPIPKLSSGLIGWRLTKKDNTLEIFGSLSVCPQQVSTREYESLRSNQTYTLCLG